MPTPTLLIPYIGNTPVGGLPPLRGSQTSPPAPPPPPPPPSTASGSYLVRRRGANPMQYLCQSTAAVVSIGPFLSISDSVTPLTALADQSAAHGRLVKAGAGSGFTASSWVADSAGYYLVGLSTSHTSAVGMFRVTFSNPTTYLPVWEDFCVLPLAVYNRAFGVIPLPATLTIAVGTVLASPAPTDHSFSVSGMPADATTGKYNGKNAVFQSGTAANLGVPFAVAATGGYTVVTPGTRADVVLASGVTMGTAPAQGDTVIFSL